MNYISHYGCNSNGAIDSIVSSWMNYNNDCTCSYNFSLHVYPCLVCLGLYLLALPSKNSFYNSIIVGQLRSFLGYSSYFGWGWSLLAGFAETWIILNKYNYYESENKGSQTNLKQIFYPRSDILEINLLPIKKLMSLCMQKRWMKKLENKKKG